MLTEVRRIDGVPIKLLGRLVIAFNVELYEWEGMVHVVRGTVPDVTALPVPSPICIAHLYMRRLSCDLEQNAVGRRLRRMHYVPHHRKPCLDVPRRR